MKDLAVLFRPSRTNAQTTCLLCECGDDMLTPSDIANVDNPMCTNLADMLDNHALKQKKCKLKRKENTKSVCVEL